MSNAKGSTYLTGCGKVENYRPKKLNPRHYRLLRFLLAGWTLSDAAKECCFTIGRASVIRNSAQFLAEERRLKTGIDETFIKAEGEKTYTDVVKQRLQSESFAALEVLVGFRDDKNVSPILRQRSALEILDRAGYGKKVEMNVKGSVLVSDDVATCIQAAIEMEQQTHASTAITGTDKVDEEKV